MIHLRKSNEKKQLRSLISMFRRGHRFREYDPFMEITWNIKSRKKFFIGIDNLAAV